MTEGLLITSGLSVMNILAIVFYAGMHIQKSKSTARQMDEIKNQVERLDGKISNGLSLRISQIDKSVGEIKAVCSERGKILEHIQESMT